MTVIFALLLSLQVGSREPARLSGVVVDATGVPVGGAEVSLDGQAGKVRTAADGRFELPVAGSPPWRLRVRSAGFRDTVEEVPQRADRLRLVLVPGIEETITVTAWRGPGGAGAAAAPVTVVPREAIAGGAAYTLDDALRQVPGFSLFRRSSSRTSNPTTQGVTLRGLSASGASRTLVLVDGVPLNDPFGGWVGWNRVPIAAIERVEVMRGGGSDLYGADAIGGVLQVVSPDPRRRRTLAQLETGSHQTVRGSLYSSVAHAGWFGALGGEAQRTEGTIPVAPAERGPVDAPAGGASRVASMTAGRQGSSGARVAVRATVFHEARENGTALQANSTTARDVGAQGQAPIAGGVLAGTASASWQTYDQSFTAINAARTIEDLSRMQRVPSDSTFASVQWSREWRRLQLVTGSETRRVTGTTSEIAFTRGRPGQTTTAGGRQQVSGAFVQAAVSPSPAWTLVFGGRGDRAAIAPEGGSSRADTAFSPRASMGWRMGEGWTARGTVTRAFRTPTLNERYRGFRVGNVVTSANEALRPERLTGVEASVAWGAPAVSARAAWFWNDVRDVVANVTLSSSPALIMRQRRNAGRARSQGLEVEASWRAAPAVAFKGALALTRARLVDAPEGLSGRRVPQVPSFQASAGAQWQPGRWQVAALIRLLGRQYDDDRNEFVLDRATVVDAQLERTVAAGLALFVAAENLFDATVEAGRTPLLTLGQPRTVRTGIRIRLE